jgi:hypothetical protein
MTQSTNARPCNCDQALELKRECARLRGYERSFHRLDRKLGAAIGERDAHAQALDAITRILCDLVSAPSLSVAQFADPTLERIRLAMLGRAG